MNPRLEIFGRVYLGTILYWYLLKDINGRPKYKEQILRLLKSPSKVIFNRGNAKSMKGHRAETVVDDSDDERISSYLHY